jgi:DNA-binding transcriptional LysR family regulator
VVDRFEELRTYVAIVEAGGVNPAAAHMGIARSAVEIRGLSE